ncbi:hypothetical protein BHM03_00020692 [Ensete ventricosum]|nr:hypothetical protein BHM03_00020692 [Ensete ventricosum]
MDKGGEVEIGEAGGRGEEELDHHVISATGGGAREDEVGRSGDEGAQEDKKGLGDHYVPSIELVDAHPPETGLEAPELVVNMGEATCIQRSTRQQRLGATVGGCFHDDASSHH